MSRTYALLLTPLHLYKEPMGPSFELIVELEKDLGGQEGGGEEEEGSGEEEGD